MITILSDYWPAFFSGASVTLAVSALVWLIGISVGFALGVAAARLPWGSQFISGLTFVVSSIPALAILFWFHYPAQTILGVVIDPFFTTVFVLSVLNIVFVADVVKFSAERLAKEYLEAAYIHGWPRAKATWLIEIPLIVRGAASRIVFIQVTMLHMTLFASLISLDELFRVAQRVNSREYKPVEVYTLISAFYFLISAPLLIVSSYLHKKFGRDFSER